MWLHVLAVTRRQDHRNGPTVVDGHPAGALGVHTKIQVSQFVPGVARSSMMKATIIYLKKKTPKHSSASDTSLMTQSSSTGQNPCA